MSRSTALLIYLGKQSYFFIVEVHSYLGISYICIGAHCLMKATRPRSSRVSKQWSFRRLLFYLCLLVAKKTASLMVSLSCLQLGFLGKTVLGTFKWTDDVSHWKTVKPKLRSCKKASGTSYLASGCQQSLTWYTPATNVKAVAMPIA